MSIRHVFEMCEPDDNTEITKAVNRVTDSEPVNGEDLLESEDLKRQLREAKERVAKND
jgi:hypothetical protein